MVSQAQSNGLTYLNRADFTRPVWHALEKRGIDTDELLQVFSSDAFKNAPQTLKEVETLLQARGKRLRKTGESVASRATELFRSLEALPLRYLRSDHRYERKYSGWLLANCSVLGDVLVSTLPWELRLTPKGQAALRHSLGG